MIQGKERTPMTAVMMPPVLNEMYLGAKFEKSNEGETTFAAMLVDIWATAMINMARIKRAGMLPVSRVTSSTGSQIASLYTTTVAAVTAIPIKEKAVIVSGSPSTCPTTCERWFLAYRVKSGMLRESVIQYPTFAAKDGQNSVKNGMLSCCNLAEVVKTLAIPPPAEKPQMRSASPPSKRSGADSDSKTFTPSTPNVMITTCMTQKTKKATNVCPGTFAHPPQTAVIRASRAAPPSQVCIPNQPQATSALAIAAKFAPLTPNEARTKTGKGTPYLVPAWAFRSIGTRTIRFPRPMVKSACHQFIPAAIRVEARR